MHGNTIALNDVEQRFSERNFKLLSEYKSARQKVVVQCFCGNTFETLPQSIFAGLTSSCGCKQRLKQQEVIKKFSNRKLKLLSEFKNTKQKVQVKCFCGKIFETHVKSVLAGLTKSCGCLLKTGPNIHSHKWSGYKEISGTFWSIIRYGAKLRKLQFEITIQDAWELFEKQNRKCALSGMDINFSKTQKEKNTTTASLDRMDSSKGYTKDNIQWVHKTVNIMKNKFIEKDFIDICKKITQNQNLA
jgi:hypothetical protein